MKYKYISFDQVHDNTRQSDLTQKCIFNVCKELEKELQLHNPISREVFIDEYFSLKLILEQDIFVKRRNTNGNIEWIITIKNSDGSYSKQINNVCPKYLNVDFDKPIARYSVERLWYDYAGNGSSFQTLPWKENGNGSSFQTLPWTRSSIKIRIDKVTCREGDMFCTATVENISMRERDILCELAFNEIRCNFMETLFRYNSDLYGLLKDRYYQNIAFQNCILDEQYKKMGQNGLDEYLKLIDICQGTYFNLCDIENDDDEHDDYGCDDNQHDENEIL